MESSFGIAASMRFFWMMIRLLASTEHKTVQESSRAILTLSGRMTIPFQFRLKMFYKLSFNTNNAFRGLLVAATHGTIVARLSFPFSVLINRLKDVELLLRDEAQQLGTPGSNTILAHIRHALDVMIGSQAASGRIPTELPLRDGAPGAKNLAQCRSG